MAGGKHEEAGKGTVPLTRNRPRMIRIQTCGSGSGDSNLSRRCLALEFGMGVESI